MSYKVALLAQPSFFLFPSLAIVLRARVAVRAERPPAVHAPVPHVAVQFRPLLALPLLLPDQFVIVR